MPLEQIAEFNRIPVNTGLISFGTTGWRSADFRGSYPKIIETLRDIHHEDWNWRQGVGPKKPEQIRLLRYLIERGIIQQSDRLNAKDARVKTSFLADFGFLTGDRVVTQVGHRLLNNQDAQDVNNPFEIAEDSWQYLRQFLLYNKDGKRPFLSLIYACLQSDNQLTLDFFKNHWLRHRNQEELDQLLNGFNHIDQPTQSIADWMNVQRNDPNTVRAFANIQNVQNLDQLTLVDLDDEGNQQILTALLTANLPHGKGPGFVVNPNANIRHFLQLWLAIQATIQEHQPPTHQQRLTLLQHMDGPIRESFGASAESFRVWAFGQNTRRIEDVDEATITEMFDHLCDVIQVGHAYNEHQMFANGSLSAIVLNFHLLWKAIKVINNLKDYGDLNLRQVSLLDIFYTDGQYLRLTPLAHAIFVKAFPEDDRDVLVIEYNEDENYRNILENIPDDWADDDIIIQRLYQARQDMVAEDPEAPNALINQHQNRFQQLIDNVYTPENLQEIFTHLQNPERNYQALRNWLNDHDIPYTASGPAFSEFALGLFWYHLRKRDEDDVTIHTLLNLKLDGNFLPISHAAGRQADLSFSWNNIGILTEVTLSQGNTQRQMEAEPVPRHLAEYVLNENTPNEALAVFTAPRLDPNNLVVLRAYKNLPWYHSQNLEAGPIQGLRILPLSFNNLCQILASGNGMETIINFFNQLIDHENNNGYTWYRDCICNFDWEQGEYLQV